MNADHSAKLLTVLGAMVLGNKVAKVVQYAFRTHLLRIDLQIGAEGGCLCW